METSKLENLGVYDRFTRISLGAMMALSVLVVPGQPLLIAALAIAASYPLMTGLTGMDPIVAIIERIHIKPITLKSTPTATA